VTAAQLVALAEADWVAWAHEFTHLDAILDLYRELATLNPR
jgi:hypothetical protein